MFKEYCKKQGGGTPTPPQGGVAKKNKVNVPVF